MIEKIYQLLKEERAGLRASDICRRALHISHVSAELSQRIVASLLSDDQRFLLTPQNRWRTREGASPWDRSISHITFVVVDVETTGLSPPGHRVTDIGAVRIEEGEMVGTFTSLVNPGRPIPSEIAAMTGITDEMVARAPAFEEICPHFLRFIKESVLVAHNASFDLAFINHELGLIGESPLANEHLCTVKLSRRLLPHLANHQLDSVALYYGLPLEGRHRGLGDALIATKIFLNFLEIVTRGMGFKTLGKVKELEGG